MNIKLTEVQNLLVLTTRVAVKIHLENIEKSKREVGDAWREVLKAIGSELGVELPPETQIVEVNGMYELEIPESKSKVEGDTDCAEEKDLVLSEA